MTSTMSLAPFLYHLMSVGGVTGGVGMTSVSMTRRGVMILSRLRLALGILTPSNMDCGGGDGGGDGGGETDRGGE